MKLHSFKVGDKVRIGKIKNTKDFSNKGSILIVPLPEVHKKLPVYMLYLADPDSQLSFQDEMFGEILTLDAVSLQSIPIDTTTDSEGKVVPKLEDVYVKSAKILLDNSKKTSIIPFLFLEKVNR